MTLLIAAVIIFMTGMLLSSRFVKNTSLAQQTVFFEREIAKRVSYFEDLVKDEQLMNRLTQSRESLNDLKNIYNSPFYFFSIKKMRTSSFSGFGTPGSSFLQMSCCTTAAMNAC